MPVELDSEFHLSPLIQGLDFEKINLKDKKYMAKVLQTKDLITYVKHSAQALKQNKKL